MCTAQPPKNQSGKNQSQKSPQADSAQSYDPSSFSDTFRAMARESLVKNQKNRPESPIVSISPVLIVLGAIAAALYGLWQSWACLIPLVLILVLMWVRYTMQRQALNDFAELEAARTAWKKTRRLARMCRSTRISRRRSWVLSAKDPARSPLLPNKSIRRALVEVNVQTPKRP